MSIWKRTETPKKNEKETAIAVVPDTAPVSTIITPGKAAEFSDDSSSSAGDSGAAHLEQRFGKCRTAIGPGTVIQGKLSFDTVVRIDGQLKGEIFSSKPLIVGPQGKVDGQIDVAALIILGSAKGKVVAKERVELYAGASLEADIRTPVLVVEHTALFKGHCDMAPAKTEKKDTSEPKSVVASPENKPAQEKRDEKPEQDKSLRL